MYRDEANPSADGADGTTEGKPDVVANEDVEEDLNLCPTMWPDSPCHLDEERDASTVDPVDDYQDQFNYGNINNYENTDRECVIDQL